MYQVVHGKRHPMYRFQKSWFANRSRSRAQVARHPNGSIAVDGHLTPGTDQVDQFEVFWRQHVFAD
jgi:hypothetical protein